ncbi:LysR family transcriptional regulator [Pseudomonas fluorescens]
MDRFQEMQTFLTVVEEGGFSAAARRLEISPASVTRAVASLEKRIGVHLILRNTRSMSLSEVGEYFLNDCRHILERLREADEGIEGIYAARPSGLLTLSAPVQFGERYIAPMLGHYTARFNEVSLSSIFHDRPANILDDGVDVAIRIGSRISDSEHAITIGEARQMLCASPGYLDTHGRPTRPEDLLTADTICSFSAQRVQEWKLMSKGVALTQRINPKISVSTTQSAIDMARRGFGITRVLSYQVMDDIALGALESVLDAFEPDALPINIVMRKNHCASTKIRSFVDFLVQHLKNDPLLRTELRIPCPEVLP